MHTQFEAAITAGPGEVPREVIISELAKTIARAIAANPQCYTLHKEPDGDTLRMVVSVQHASEAVAEAKR